MELMEHAAGDDDTLKKEHWHLRRGWTKDHYVLMIGRKWARNFMGLEKLVK